MADSCADSADKAWAADSVVAAVCGDDSRILEASEGDGWALAADTGTDDCTVDAAEEEEDDDDEGTDVGGAC